MRTTKTSRPKPVAVFVPKRRSPTGMAHRSRTPSKTITKSIQFQKNSSSEQKKPLKPSSRTRTTISKTKKRRIPWFTHHHAGLGESVSNPRTAAFRQMIPPDRYWNQSFSVQMKLACLNTLQRRSKRRKLRMPRNWSCPGGTKRGSTKTCAMPATMTAASTMLQNRSCLSNMNIRQPWWEIRHTSSAEKKTRQASSSRRHSSKASGRTTSMETITRLRKRTTKEAT
mmetsp:Transcript_45538/g.106475  ORF Transcript_45538/g.106475 Transcript_45538/m.106475 type:complete len:226 (+) Transcript_45538:1409-2086(+)